MFSIPTETFTTYSFPLSVQMRPLLCSCSHRALGEWSEGTGRGQDTGSKAEAEKGLTDSWCRVRSCVLCVVCMCIVHVQVICGAGVEWVWVSVYGMCMCSECMPCVVLCGMCEVCV